MKSPRDSTFRSTAQEPSLAGEAHLYLPFQWDQEFKNLSCQNPVALDPRLDFPGASLNRYLVFMSSGCLAAAQHPFPSSLAISCFLANGDPWTLIALLSGRTWSTATVRGRFSIICHVTTVFATFAVLERTDCPPFLTPQSSLC